MFVLTSVVAIEWGLGGHTLWEAIPADFSGLATEIHYLLGFSLKQSPMKIPTEIFSV